MKKLSEAWYSNASWPHLLRPLGWVFGKISAHRKKQYLSGNRQVWKAPVPVIVVGNITVGGTGKTPLVIWLVNALQEKGYRPGVVSRGYGASSPNYPQWVTATTPVDKSGDEALLIARQTRAPVVIDPDRPRAIQTLLSSNDCDLVISDDGLQHYAMGRKLEIAVVDGSRGFGNGCLMPAGPLREPVQRLRETDFVVINGEGSKALVKTIRGLTNRSEIMHLRPAALVNIRNQESQSLEEAGKSATVHAVAGIGNPERFFSALEKAGFSIVRHPFPDHHAYTASDLDFGDDALVIMTEKDAVKCTRLANANTWYLSVNAELPETFIDKICQRL